MPVELRQRRGRAGFSLIEIMVVVALLAIMTGALAPMGVRQIQAGKRAETQADLRRIALALIGDPAQTTFGYLGEMGALPPTLEDLNDATGKPAYAIDPNDGVGYGYNGPYAAPIAPPGVVIVDAWARPYQYNAAAAQVTSGGPDRQIGTADDLTFPFTPPVTRGNLTVTVTGIPNDGSPPEVLDTARVDVFVASSAAGTRTEALMAGAGPFNAANLHLGLHGLRIVGTGSYAGAARRDVVVIRGGTTAANVRLDQP